MGNRRIGVTMRRSDPLGYMEPRDSLARDWAKTLREAIPCVQWVPVPNLGAREVSSYVQAWGLNGFVLTGGEDIGADPVRDETEWAVVDLARAYQFPVLGVCRGFQVLQRYFGGVLKDCDSSVHVGVMHEVNILSNALGIQSADKTHMVNSFHHLGVISQDLANNLIPFAVTPDGWVEAAMNLEYMFVGVMWHPERYGSVRELDRVLFRSLFYEN